MEVTPLDKEFIKLSEYILVLCFAIRYFDYSEGVV